MTRKRCVLLSSVREFIEIEAWLILVFSLSLHIQISSINFINTCQEKFIHQIDSEWRMVAPFSNFYGKIWVGFSLNAGKRFFLALEFLFEHVSFAVSILNRETDLTLLLPLEMTSILICHVLQEQFCCSCI